jgi:putative protease
MSANRGLCRQPCRRIYRGDNADGYLFSLNDLELLPFVPELAAAGVDSFKIEGRMKSAEYVWTAARAYRMVLDDPGKMQEARELLAGDLGRQKTPYFAGGDVSGALTGSAFTGRLLGTIEKKSTPDGFTFTPAFPLTRRARLRILGKGGRDTEQLKIFSLQSGAADTDNAPAGAPVTVITGPHEGRPGDEVYLSMAGEKKFPDKIAPGKFSFTMKLAAAKQAAILRGLVPPVPPRERELLLRVDSLAWLPKIFFQRIDTLILALTLEEAATLDLARPFLQKNLAKIALQLPLFIPEGRQAAWRTLCKKLAAAGLTRFVLGQPGQQRLVPELKGIVLLAGEDAYRLNDAAAAALREQGFATGILPLENDLANLEATRDRSGIVPRYFRPPLFRSRMPVTAGEAPLRDQHAAYLLHTREGMTIVTPDRPVCLFQHRARLETLGYRRFLVDCSIEKPSQNTFNRLLGNFDTGQPEKQALLFNFKGGLQ